MLDGKVGVVFETEHDQDTREEIKNKCYSILREHRCINAKLDFRFLKPSGNPDIHVGVTLEISRRTAGRLGCFALFKSNASEYVCGITCNHILSCNHNEQVYFDSNGLGIVQRPLLREFDIAAFKIHTEMLSRCDARIQTPDLRPVPFKVFDFTQTLDTDLKVKLWGSGCTNYSFGSIASFPCSPRENQYIVLRSDDILFKAGDSGALVCFEKDSSNFVLGLVVGEICEYRGKHENEKLTLVTLLNAGLTALGVHHKGTYELYQEYDVSKALQHPKSILKSHYTSETTPVQKNQMEDPTGATSDPIGATSVRTEQTWSMINKETSDSL